MSSQPKELLLRAVYAVPLLGFGLWAFIYDGSAWSTFLALLAIGIVGEIAYRQLTCQYKKPGHDLHCLLLFVSAIVGFSVMYTLRESKQGTALIFLGAVMVIFFDTFSLFAGKFQPKSWRRQIAPKESPNKTWGGFIGGTVLSLIAGGVTLSLLEQHYVSIDISKPVMYVLLLLTPVVAYFGDLNESMAKRRLFRVVDSYRQISPTNRVALKDFSNLLGPHGGVSDRFDAMTAVFATVGLAWLLLI